MRGAYNQFIRQKGLQAVENAMAKLKEEAELRLARIQNGKEPSHVNGSATEENILRAEAKNDIP